MPDFTVLSDITSVLVIDVTSDTDKSGFLSRAAKTYSYSHNVTIGKQHK